MTNKHMKRCSVLLIKRNANKNYNEVPLHTNQTLLFSHSVTSDSATGWTAACQASLSFTISQSLFKLMSIELVMPSKDLILDPFCVVL